MNTKPFPEHHKARRVLGGSRGGTRHLGVALVNDDESVPAEKVTPARKTSKAGRILGLSSSAHEGGNNGGKGSGGGKQRSASFQVLRNAPAAEKAFPARKTTGAQSRPGLRTGKMSRRARASVLRGAKQMKANRAFVPTVCLEKTNAAREECALRSVVLKSLGRERLCDVEIIGKDELPVECPSYLLAVHSDVLEEYFYGEGREASLAASLERKQGEESGGSEYCRHLLELPFATWDAINAAVDFLVTDSLPEVLENEANENNLRTMCQMHMMGRIFHMTPLADQAYRTARLFMNKVPNLVCAAFDECVVCTGLLGDKYKLPPGQDELNTYALEYLRESPLTTLLAEGTLFLSAESMEAILDDEEMDIDETTMFHVLNSWVKNDEDFNREKGRALASRIDLSFVKTDYLKNVVRKCGFVDPPVVDAALREIEEHLANQAPDEKEHVLVKGAGKECINGVYARMEEDVGLGEDEIVYVKECREDEDYCLDYGMYLLKGTWAITPCVDYSNVLYSCEAPSSGFLHKAPSKGWKTVGGVDPPPACTWNPSKDDRAAGKGYLAPNLDGGTGKHFTDVANGDHDEGRRRYTLNTMMNLPTDEGHEEDDYPDDIDASDGSF